MSSLRFVLRAIERTRAEQAKIEQAQQRQVKQFRKRLERANAPRLKRIASTLAAQEELLKRHNPFAVGDVIQGTAPDGLPSANRYQVTRVKDHKSLWARVITKKGQLGAESVYIEQGRGYGPALENFKKAADASVTVQARRRRR